MWFSDDVMDVDLGPPICGLDKNLMQLHFRAFIQFAVK